MKNERFENTEQKPDVIAGRNPVSEAVRSNRPIDKILVAKGEKSGAIVGILAKARDKKIPVKEVDRTKLDYVSGGATHQGIVAFAAAKDYSTVDDILKYAESKGEAPFVVVLDEVEDPHNLGAIIRTAECAGVHGIIIPKRRSAGLSYTVAKASAGAIEYMRVARVTNIAVTLDELKDAASEKSAIEKFASQGYQAVISLSSNDRALQIETCEENQIYYAVAAGTLDQEQFEKYKTNEYFLGQVGPSMDTEYEAGVEMGRFFAEKGIKTAAIYGAFIPNPMHVYRVAGVLSGLGLSYDGATEEGEVVGKIFTDQSVDLSKISGDIQIVSYLQGYGDTTTDEINAAIQAKPEAFISVGMATTFFTQQLNAAGIEFSDIDSFTQSNGEAITNGKLVYLAGKYSSSVGPAFALVLNAINGNVIRDEQGNAVSLSQNYQVATDEATFDEFYKSDNGDNPIYNKETLDQIIGESVTFDEINELVTSK